MGESYDAGHEPDAGSAITPCPGGGAGPAAARTQAEAGATTAHTGPVGSFVDRLPPVRTFRELRRDFDRLVLVLAAGDLVANFGFALVFPFLTIYLVEKLGATAAEAGLVTALYSVCSIASGAVGGWLADRFGRRRVMIVSIASTGVVIALMGRTGSLATIALLTVVLGIVDPPFVPAARAAVSDVVREDRRPRAYGLLSVANAVGWIAGPAIGAGLSSLGYDVLFLVAGILIGSFAIIAFTWLPETLGRTAQGDTGGRSTGAAGPGASPAIVGLEAASPELQPHGARRATAGTGPDDPGNVRRRARAFAAFLAIAMAAQGAIFLWVSVLPVHASGDLGVATGTWGLLFSLNGILIVAFQLRISTAVEGMPKVFVMAGGMLCYAIAMAIVAAAQDPAWAIPAIAAAVVTITCGEMLFYPTEAAFVSDVSPVDRRGRNQGFLLAAAGVGTALGPPIGGYVLDTAPGPMLWFGAAVIFLACAGALGLLGRATRSLPSAEGA